MDLKAKLVEKVSTKTGKNYLVIEINITDTYVKQVFLDNAELELLKLSTKKQ